MLLENRFKRFAKRVLLALGLLSSIGPSKSWAQGFSELPHEYYSVNDGLSDRLVTDILQTEDGLLWLATANGLNRFDGYHFLVFDNHPNNPHQIAEANIRRLHLNQQGKIVIIFSSGYAHFDLLDPYSHEVETVQLLPSTGLRGIPRDIRVTATGDILALSVSDSATHLYRYSGGGRFDLLFSIPETHLQKSVAVQLLPLQGGDFLINDGEKGLRHFSASGVLLRALAAADLTSVVASEYYPANTNFMHQDANGKVWIAWQGHLGMYHYLPSEQRLSYSEELPRWQYFTRLWEDESGNLLLANTEKAEERYPLTGMTGIKPDGKQYSFDAIVDISSFVVSAYSLDFFESLILGIDTGLKIVQNRQSRVKTYLAGDVGADRRGAVMRGIAGNGHDEIFWAREVEEWYRFNPITEQLDTLPMVDERTGEVVPMSCGCNLEMGSDGYIWGVSCLDLSSGKLHRYDRRACTMRTYAYDHQFAAFTIGRDGKLWLVAEPASPSGLLVAFDPKTEQFTEYYDLEGRNPLEDSSPKFILEAKDGTLWVGTENGLHAIDRDSRQSKVYRAVRGQQNGLASNIVYAIHEDEQGRLWLGTTNGFNIFDPKTELFLHYNQQDELASNIVCGFVPAGNGHYWISTFNGLSYFNPEKSSFRNFYRKDGLSHDEFNRFSYYRDQHGNNYFGGVNGMNVFRSEDLLLEAHTPAPILTAFSRYNSRLDSTIVQVSKLKDLSALHIYPSDSYFTLNYSIPNYASPKHNRFKTWLRGYDKDWVYQGSTPQIRYNSLPPGEYTLLIKGADANGNWSEASLELPIYVHPPFYRTFLFFMICGLLLVALAYALFQYRLEQRLKMERIRTKLSSDLHDEVSGLLAGIAMQTDLMQILAKDGAVRERLQRMGEASRVAMSKMSDVIWSIDSRKDQFEDLLLRMKEHADEILSPLDISYHFQVRQLDRKKRLPVTLRQDLYFIFKEAVNNIAKHSGASSVHIHLHNEGRHFVMLIKDNGQHDEGAALSVPGKTGQGLANIRMRAERIKAEVAAQPVEDGFVVSLRRPRFT